MELKKTRGDKRAGSLFQSELNESHLVSNTETDSKLSLKNTGIFLCKFSSHPVSLNDMHSGPQKHTSYMTVQNRRESPPGLVL